VSTSEYLRIGVEIDLATSLALVGAAVDDAVLEALREAGLHGLRRGHGFVVQRLVEGPETVGVIASGLGVSQQAVSKSVRELVELGYVEQREDPADRRRRPVRLTRRGRRAVSVARGARARITDELVARCGPRQVGAALVVLREAADLLGRTEQLRSRIAPPPAETT
jgi:DNA-binding MarR family transcriptional regulator